MDASLRNTPGLTSRIDKLRDDMIKHFNAVVGLAAAGNNDRNVTAIAQYQMQVETAALIRAAEDVQTLVRQLQEMWLFGQLNTVGEGKVKQQTDEDAQAVAQLLQRLAKPQQSAVVNGAEGTAVDPEKDTMEAS